MRRLAPLLLLAACGTPSLPPFGQLRTPGGLAAMPGRDLVFVASQTADELRVLDIGPRDPTFLVAPNALFPLSVPTVPWPTALAAGERVLFVLSSTTAQLGFVDGGAVDRTGDLAPRTFTAPLALALTPSALASLDAPFPAGGASDRAVVAGLDGALQGRLDVVRAPSPLDPASTASVERVIALPGAFPVDVAVEPGVKGLLAGEGPAPVADCRLVAVADARFEEGHTPGVLLLQLRVDAGGALTVAAPPRLVPVPVDVGGAVVNAPVREVALVPAPVTPALQRAVVEDPCAVRSGRLVAVLDPVYCGTESPCPDVAFLDLPGGAVATDEQGGPAIYDVPGAALGLAIAPGPISFTTSGSFQGGFTQAGARVQDAPALALVTSGNGAIYFLHAGLGSVLAGPGERATPDPVFRIDSEQAGPGASAVVRRGGGTGVSAPSIEALQPHDESWSATYRGPLPGLETVGTVADLGDGVLEAPAGLGSFRAPMAVVSGEPGGPGDVVLPVPSGGATCTGFEVESVEEDGSALTVRTTELPEAEPAACTDPEAPLAIVPSAAAPWTLVGSVTGIVPRVAAGAEEPGGARSSSVVLDGERRLFRFTPPAGVGPGGSEIPRGATWTFTTSDGFRFLNLAPTDVGGEPLLLPSAIEALPSSAGPASPYRVFVTYSGTDAVVAIEPRRPQAGRVGLFQ